MVNNVESNFREKVMPIFLQEFDNNRVFSKTVDTQLLTGVFNADSGESVAYKRGTDYLAIETTDGDLTGEDASPIIVGNGFARVQNRITVLVEYQRIEQALKLNQLAELLRPAAKRAVTQLELNMARFMIKNTGLLSGTVGTPAASWTDVADAGAIMQATGVPMDNMWTYVVNPFTQTALANEVRSLGAGGAVGTDIKTALDTATISESYAGFGRVMTATTQASYISDSEADRAGTLSGNPDVTYVTAKDTMTQILPVQDFGNDLEIKAGEQIQITGRNRLNLSTRELVVDASGNPIVWTGTVTADVILSGTGTGNITVTGPAIFETGSGNGAFNTVDSAPVSTDVVTLLGAASTTKQPNLFYHKQAFGVGFVELPNLDAQQNSGTTKDGIHIRVTRGSDFIKDKNMVRFDLQPAFAALNPFLAGQGFG